MNPENSIGHGIVAIGGGTGLSTMLRGLKKHIDDITAIVAVSDDGGGSGVLRTDLNMLPPGDIRNCIIALSNTEQLMSRLLSHRFHEGLLDGQSFGNLFLAALNQVTGSFYQSVRYMSDVLAITGRVLPVTTEDVHIEAEFENGAVVRGESNINTQKKLLDSPIRHIRMIPEHPKALSDTISAITNARLLIFGPGSLYTSIIPNLLVDGIVDAVRASNARKVYICNVMTQDGETENYTATDHIKALFDHSYDGLFDTCIANNAEISRELIKKYAAEGAEPMPINEEDFKKMGIKLILKPLISENTPLARHDPARLAEVIMDVYNGKL
ncbi:MAG: YvcK family protein [Oscillospiraceae bacterium]|nr:YvcK family protein [Oscillospiraceae bacterium]MBQ7054625.1 YvcK family protein [Oscillospiraceae bacterium]